MHDSSVYEESGPEGARVSVSRAAILDEVTAICAPPAPVGDDEFMAGDLVERWGCSFSKVERILTKQVQAGTLERRRAMNPETGRQCWAYRLA